MRRASYLVEFPVEFTDAKNAWVRAGSVHLVVHPEDKRWNIELRVVAEGMEFIWWRRGHVIPTGIGY